MRKNWIIKTPDTNLQILLSRELGINLITAQVLINRGIHSIKKAKEFLRSHISDLSSAHKFPDIKKSITRLQKAVKNKEKIFVFGDYDVDGISSAALLGSVLLQEGADVSCYLPHRVKDGYGLNKDMVKLAKQKKASLFICVDCGTSDKEEIKALRDAKIDTIVMDHHECKGSHPVALGFINPKRRDSNYAYRDLASVGIVFRFLQAYTGKDLLSELDLVSLGTIADVAPLNGENRILVKEGLKQIEKTKRPGLIALIESCGLKDKNMSCSNVGYILGPRLNATGRIDHAEKSLHLLMSKNHADGKELSQQLCKLNSRRQRIGEEVLQEAISMADDTHFKENYAIVLAKEGWHQGVLGIIASRIAERFYRPTIIISLSDGIGKGSARSIKDFHLYDALSKCSHILDSFGGHKGAAGLTISRRNVDKFTKMMNDAAKAVLKTEHLIPSIDIDAEVKLSDINETLLSEIDSLEPFGAENMRPLFCSKNLEVKDGACVLKANTLKFWVSDGSFTCCAIGYRMKEYLSLVQPGVNVDIVYAPRLDTWQGQSQITLEVKDIKVSSKD